MQKILYHGLRWFLALVMILYGLDKIIGLQFSEGIHYFDRPIRALTGVELLWAFFAYSRPLQIAVGLAEIGMAALLLPRRLVSVRGGGSVPDSGQCRSVRFLLQCGLQRTGIRLYPACHQYLSAVASPRAFPAGGRNPVGRRGLKENSANEKIGGSEFGGNRAARGGFGGDATVLCGGHRAGIDAAV